VLQPGQHLGNKKRCNHLLLTRQLTREPWNLCRVCLWLATKIANERRWRAATQRPKQGNATLQQGKLRNRADLLHIITSSEKTTLWQAKPSMCAPARAE
jgi:hypothetical protein